MPELQHVADGRPRWCPACCRTCGVHRRSGSSCTQPRRVHGAAVWSGRDALATLDVLTREQGPRRLPPCDHGARPASTGRPDDRADLPGDAVPSAAEACERVARRTDPRPARRAHSHRRRMHWSDAVTIEGEDRTVAMRTRTHEDELILPTELPGESGAVWFRDGRCEDVLAELLEL